MRKLDTSAEDANYKLFFSLSSDLFCIADGKDYFRHLNSEWEKVLGYTLDELKSRPISHFICQEDKAKTKAASTIMRSGRSVLNFENRFVTKDGSIKYFLWNAHCEPNSDLRYCVARDVTDLKVAEERLMAVTLQSVRQKDEIMTLFKQMPALVAKIRGPEHVFEFANEPYLKMLGQQNVVERKVTDVIPNLDESFLSILNKVVDTGERFVAQDYGVKGDWLSNGKIFERYFTFIFEPIFGKTNEVSGYWVVAFETTEFKKMESRLRISERMASLGTLAAGVAHEVNNPLSFTLGKNYLLEQQIQSATGEQFLKNRQELLSAISAANEGLERIRKIVRSLKMFSRIDDEAPTRINLPELLRSTIQFADNEIRFRARLRFDFKPVPDITARPGQLGQVFLNLIVNAAQAIPMGSVDRNEIVIQTEVLPSGDISVAIRDTGCGIPSEIIERIFDPFYTSKPVGEGTGLGLSVCHGIITSLGGEITVESMVQVGTTFRIQFPKSLISSPELKDVSIQKTETFQPSPCRRILVVDDEEFLAETIQEMLRCEHRVQVCNSVSDALSQLKTFDPEIIFCDLMMPTKTGMDLYQILRDSGQNLHQRMIFMTGGAFTREAKNFLSEVSNPTLDKPFTAFDLFEVIRLFSPVKDERKIS